MPVNGDAQSQAQMTGAVTHWPLVFNTSTTALITRRSSTRTTPPEYLSAKPAAICTTADHARPGWHQFISGGCCEALFAW
jgi:hypothetical protein